ncbi:hypothetical protein JZ751_027497 [Albula glossodonta]|uniref:Uncharacterized protein n=1 Tax=Albula glossodonta TaxID=121402 RepID=A0A8T2NDE4_9TELE|nr:hypothetical protein JZ751_027497 [Albula glossodonta]
MPLRIGRKKKAPPLVESEEAEPVRAGLNVDGWEGFGGGAGRGGGGEQASLERLQPGLPPPPLSLRPRLTFHTQLAHGSPTGRIEGFSNVRELYAKIGEAFGISPAEVMFCTLNTHKVDMEKLLGGQIGLEDFIFAHVKGQKKEVEVFKGEEGLGLTITDNGAGYAFVKVGGKRIIQAGNTSSQGTREGGVWASMEALADRKCSQQMMSSRQAGNIIQSRTQHTLGIREGSVIQQMQVISVGDMIESINGQAATMVELGKDKRHPDEFAEALDETLGDFAFPDEFVFDVWGAISDAKVGQL